MAEPIGPEVYLAIATSMQNAVNNYRDKKRVEQNHKLAIISTDSSKSSLTLPADELLSCSGLKIGNDGYVQWSLISPAYPRNWSRGRKAYDIGFILFLEFLMSLINAAGTPASFYGLGVLGHRREVGLLGFTTMYLLGQALGVLILSPYVDKFGRRTLYIASAFLYSVFCLPVAATSNVAGVFVGRLITGIISAIPAITTRGSIEDLFGAEARMWAFFSWALVTNLGLVLGPIYASYVSVSLDWRWPFYLATIIVACTGMLIYFIRESHPSQLLELKVSAIQSHRADLILRTAPTTPRPSIFDPVTLLCTNPLVFFSSLTNAFSTALLYLFAVAFPLIYAHYAWSTQKTTLIFLFIALGLLLSTIPKFHTRHIIRKSHLSNHPLTPEHNLFLLAIAAPALAAALWWFAWTIPNSATSKTTIAWPTSATSLILLGYGVNAHSNSFPRYLLDSYVRRNDASVAFAALLVTKALLGAVFPLFTQQLFENLDYNVAGSVLAAIATALCFVPAIFFRFGGKWRGNVNGRGSLSGGRTTNNGEEMEDRMEEEGKKSTKQKKTVRWGDEMTDSGSSSSTESASETKESENRASESESESEDRSKDRTNGSGGMERIETETTEPEVEAEVEAEAEKSEGSSEVPALSRQQTRIETRDFASSEAQAKVETKNQHENEIPAALSPARTTQTCETENENENEIARVETKSSNTSNSSNGGTSGSTGGKEGKKKKKKKTVMSEVDDDRDNGAMGGLWGMDLERLAVVPYF